MKCASAYLSGFEALLGSGQAATSLASVASDTATSSASKAWCRAWSGTLPRTIAALTSVEASNTITPAAARPGARRCGQRAPLRGCHRSGRGGVPPPTKRPWPQQALDAGRPDHAPDQPLDAGARRWVVERGGGPEVEFEGNGNGVGHGMPPWADLYTHLPCQEKAYDKGYCHILLCGFTMRRFLVCDQRHSAAAPLLLAKLNRVFSDFSGE